MSGRAVYPGTFDPFTAERADRIRAGLPAAWDNVTVVAWAGLTADYCRAHGATVLVRGVRNQADLRHEYPLSVMNESLGITTLLIPARPELARVSSTAVRGQSH